MIRVEDNFFDEKMFTYIRRHVTTKLVFEPRYLDYAKENFNGWRFKWVKDKDLLAIFTKQAEKTFRLNIKQLANEGEDPTGGVDLRMIDRFKPHTDIEEGSKLNILVMLAGPTAVTNGTVFYTDDQLDTHVGFRENRAIMFPSNKVHSGNVSVVPNLRRYTASIFVKDYELV